MKTMNIAAQKGDKVIYSFPNNGYISDQSICAKHLILGNEYTIEKIDIDGFSTDVYLKELPNICFNSVMFRDVEKPTLKLGKTMEKIFEYKGNSFLIKVGLNKYEDMLLKKTHEITINSLGSVDFHHHTKVSSNELEVSINEAQNLAIDFIEKMDLSEKILTDLGFKSAHQ